MYYRLANGKIIEAVQYSQMAGSINVKVQDGEVKAYSYDCLLHLPSGNICVIPKEAFDILFAQSESSDEPFRVTSIVKPAFKLGDPRFQEMKDARAVSDSSKALETKAQEDARKASQERPKAGLDSLGFPIK